MLTFNLILIIVLTPIAIAAFSLAPWMPMKSGDLARINKLAKLREGEIFYEIGFGDSRVCRYIAIQNPQAHVLGIEMAMPLYLFAKLKNLIFPVKNLTLIYGNALNRDLSKVDVIYTFAMQKSLNSKLKEKFLKELKKNAKIISYVFSMKEWEGEKYTDKSVKKGGMPIHVYVV